MSYHDIAIDRTQMMTHSKRIRVLVIDDSESIRFSLRQVLAAFADLQWVGESQDGHDVLEQCERLRPDAVLMDVALTHVDVPQTVRLIREHFPVTYVIGIAGFEEQSLIAQVLQAGATLYLSKNANVVQIADAVRQVAQLASGSTWTTEPGTHAASRQF